MGTSPSRTDGAGIENASHWRTVNMQTTTSHRRPFTADGFLMALLVLCAGAAMPVQAQNHFPAPIPFGSLTFGLQAIATVPDSAPGQPPRLSVLTTDPVGRLFVNDQRGPLYLLVPSGGGVFSAAQYLDLRDFPEVGVFSTSEAGFQSFAFHPQFATVGAPGFGRLYTVSSSKNTSRAPDFDPGGRTSFHTLVLEWRTADPNATTFVATNPSAPFREVLRFSQPFGNHNAGLVAFAPNVPSTTASPGLLYLALGDGGSGGDPQENGEDPGNPYGAILRIDPLGTNAPNGRYGIVPENALAADGLNTTLGEIFAFGLRNPQRFGWDTKTGHMYTADIGQNAVEEINLVANGGDFGWDRREGSFPFEGGGSALIDPIAEYDHTTPVSEMPTSIGNRAVTLGEVVRASLLPGLNGHLIVADFPTGLFFALNVDTATLNGGQSELRQVRLRSQAGQTLPFISFINAARAVRGLGTASRADLRFGVNTPGRVFLINKHDGIVRELTLDPTLDSDGYSCPDILDDGPTSALHVVGHYVARQCPLGGGSVHASAGADPEGVVRATWSRPLPISTQRNWRSARAPAKP
jgi:hypothetical protein